MPSFCSSGLHEVLAECCFLVSWSCFCLLRRFPDGSVGKESARNAGDLGLIPGLGRSRGGGHPTVVFLPGESPRKEEPGGLQSTGLQRVRHN